MKRKQYIAEPSTCPHCKEKDVHPQNTTADGTRFRRCPECAYSWFTHVNPPASATDGKAPDAHS